jgi:hypothetical protein
MKLLRIEESPKPGKKFRAIFDNDGRTKVTDFGAAGMTDYTLSKEAERRAHYRQRHKKDLATGDPTRAGFLSYYILWGPFTSVRKNTAYYRAKFNL